MRAFAYLSGGSRCVSLPTFRADRDACLCLPFGLIESMVWRNALFVAFVLPFLSPLHGGSSACVLARP